MMFIIGLTGGIGSGKSTAADFFKSFADVVDADEIARSIVKPNSMALKAIASHFDKLVIAPDGTLNRPWLRDKIFSEPDEKSWLETLLHPLIRTEIISALHNSKSPYCILMSPLLLETDQHLLTNRILVIDAPEDKQIARVIKRDHATKEAVKAIMSTQLSPLIRLQKADDIVINAADISTLKKSILHLHSVYLMLAASS
jgi:dephospho-CoA kinase